jgi:hypothetical protein
MNPPTRRRDVGPSSFDMKTTYRPISSGGVVAYGFVGDSGENGDP